MGVLEDYDRESTLFLFIFELEAKSGVWEGCFWHTMFVEKGWNADEERWIMSI